MSFSTNSNGVSGASDVALSNPITGHFFGYNGSVDKWENRALTGTAALSAGGGLETVNTFNASGAASLNLANGNVFNVTLVGNTTLTFTGATAGRACAFTLYKRQDATGGRTITLPSSIKWAGGAPTLTTTANSIDILVFETLDGGTTWFGSLVGLNFS